MLRTPSKPVNRCECPGLPQKKARSQSPQSPQSPPHSPFNVISDGEILKRGPPPVRGEPTVRKDILNEPK